MSTIDPTSPVEVTIALYHHSNGTNDNAFARGELALEWRTNIAKYWWSAEFNEEPPPDEELIGETYFQLMSKRKKVFKERFEWYSGTVESQAAPYAP
jgi:hypothetical protein